MSEYYNPKRTYNKFDKKSKIPFKLSRSKLDLYFNCPRCFYLDTVFGISQPPGYPFTLNSAVDNLLKKEFDIHRAEGTPHPLMKTYNIDAVPLRHEKIRDWRDSRDGINFLHKKTNLLITGRIDDLWVNKGGELLIVDYKATAKAGEVNIDAEWQKGYKRQMEIYQWLFRQNGFRVSNTAYFVYCNGDTDKKAFDGKLEFNVKIIPYVGDDSWVDKLIIDAKECLISNVIPKSKEDCDFCKYRYATREVENN